MVAAVDLDASASATTLTVEVRMLEVAAAVNRPFASTVPPEEALQYTVESGDPSTKADSCNCLPDSTIATAGETETAIELLRMLFADSLFVESCTLMAVIVTVSCAGTVVGA